MAGLPVPAVTAHRGPRRPAPRLTVRALAPGFERFLKSITTSYSLEIGNLYSRSCPRPAGSDCGVSGLTFRKSVFLAVALSRVTLPNLAFMAVILIPDIQTERDGRLRQTGRGPEGVLVGGGPDVDPDLIVLVELEGLRGRGRRRDLGREPYPGPARDRSEVAFSFRRFFVKPIRNQLLVERAEDFAKLAPSSRPDSVGPDDRTAPGTPRFVAESDSAEGRIDLATARPSPDSHS